MSQRKTASEFWERVGASIDRAERPECPKCQAASPWHAADCPTLEKCTCNDIAVACFCPVHDPYDPADDLDDDEIRDHAEASS